MKSFVAKRNKSIPELKHVVISPSYHIGNYSACDIMCIPEREELKTWKIEFWGKNVSKLHSPIPTLHFCQNLVSFFKMNFSRRPFHQKPLVFGKNPRTHLEAQEHLVLKGLCKNVKNHRFSRNPLQYSMRQKIGDAGSISTQNMSLWNKICGFAEKPFFSVFWPYRIPCFALLRPLCSCLS